VRNALTVDVEEWFHVCGVPALGIERWDGLPSRIDVTTDRVLTLCAERRLRFTATSSLSLSSKESCSH